MAVLSCKSKKNVIFPALCFLFSSSLKLFGKGNIEGAQPLECVDKYSGRTGHVSNMLRPRGM